MHTFNAYPILHVHLLLPAGFGSGGDMGGGFGQFFKDNSGGGGGGGGGGGSGYGGGGGGNQAAGFPNGCA